MPAEIPIARTLWIRESGFDEYWLQDQIYQNPGSLGLGDLDAISKEKSQSSGGRLDLLLKDPDDDSMYEVEVMLGETDERHIIRTIEYWDNERRIWPQREHFAVLVAESITRRFFNVIQLLGRSVPIIAIQANLIEANGNKILSFTRVLDVYEEPAEPGSDVDAPTTEDDWRKKSLWTLETAVTLRDVVKPVLGDINFRFRKSYIGLEVDQDVHFWLQKLSGNRSKLGFWINAGDMDEAAKLLGEGGVTDVKKKRDYMEMNTDEQAVLTGAETFKTIARLVRQYFGGVTH